MKTKENKDLISDSMKYVYFDLARIGQENMLSSEVKLEYENAFERLLGIALINHAPTWKDIFRMIRNKFSNMDTKE